MRESFGCGVVEFCWFSFWFGWLSFGSGCWADKFELGFPVIIAFSGKLGHDSKHYPSKYEPN